MKINVVFYFFVMLFVVTNQLFSSISYSEEIFFMKVSKLLLMIGILRMGYGR